LYGKTPAFQLIGSLLLAHFLDIWGLIKFLIGAVLHHFFMKE